MKKKIIQAFKGKSNDAKQMESPVQFKPLSDEEPNESKIEKQHIDENENGINIIKRLYYNL